MIKKLLLIAALIVPMMAASQNLKIGIIDTNEIIGLMPETKAADTKMNETQKQYEAQFASIQDELKKQYDELQNMKEDEPQAIKERKFNEFQATQQKAETFQQTVYTDLQKLQNELMAPIIQKIQGAIESVGKENGYSLIQEKGNQLYFAAPVEDITPLVKTKLGL